MLQSYSDVVKMEDRVSFIRRMHEIHKKSIKEFPTSENEIATDFKNTLTH